MIQTALIVPMRNRAAIARRGCRFLIVILSVMLGAQINLLTTLSD